MKPILKFLKIRNGEDHQWNIDNGGSGSIIQDEHRKIHEGKHYFIRDFETKANDEIIEFVLQVPSNTLPHMKCIMISTQGMEYEIYEGATGITGGTSKTPFNNNRTSSNSSGMTIIKDPTGITSDGNKLCGMSMGNNKVSGTADLTDELIMKPSTNYLWRITSLDSSNVISYYGKWYEVDI